MTEQQRHWLKTGLLFGYPNCCVDSFLQLNHLKTGIVRKLNGTGFIPCDRCNIHKTEEEMIQEINKNRCREFKPFKAIDPEPEMLFIVMGRASKRIYEHSPIPLSQRAAEWHASRLNYTYYAKRLAVEFYITPILDV